jgi:hypothetical protein
MKGNFKDSIKGNINTSSQDDNDTKNKDLTLNDDTNTSEEESIDSSNTLFTIAKKVDDKKGKKTFNVYMDPNLAKELDKISKRTGWSRNEIINKMCDFCVNNIKIEE